MHDFPNKIYSDIDHLGSADQYFEDIVNNVDQVRFFQAFDKSELRVLTKYMACYGAPRDYTLFQEGYESHCMLMIVSGEAETSTTETSNKTSLALGSTMGGLALVEPYIWEATCVTTKPTDIAIMTKASLNNILVNNPRLGNKVLLRIIDLMSLHYKQNVMKDTITEHNIAN